jgi:hypothetical protein
MDEPPAIAVLVAVIAKFSIFAFSAPLATVRTTWSAAPLSLLFESADHDHPFKQLKPPIISMPAATDTDSAKGALVQA